LDGYNHQWEDHQEDSQVVEAPLEAEDFLEDSLEVEDHPHQSLFPQHRSFQEAEGINS
jgi:hypothetical protein